MKQQIIKQKIGNKIYEKVCNCNGIIIKTFPQTNIKVTYNRIDFNSLVNKPQEGFIYTQEMEDKAIRLIAAKRIIKQSKTIDFQRFILRTIINTNNSIELIRFICSKLESINYKTKQIETTKIIEYNERK